MEDTNKRFKPINNQTKVDQIINLIINSITNGRFKAGSKLPNEYELIEELQVSRNSLREAMKILSTMGIVEIKRGDGTYVCSQINPNIFDNVVYSMIFDLSTSNELVELRQILDEATLRLAMDKITECDIQNLNENIIKMSNALEKGDGQEAKKYDYQFHILLIESCKNTFFIRIVKGVYNIFRQSIGDNVETEKNSSLAPIYHKKMIDCIVNKQYSKVNEIVSESLITWKNRVKK